MTLTWNDLDTRAVVTAKVLAADAVENAGSGHPGAAISLAPAAYLLFQRHLKLDPQDPTWVGRDRFVLSAGHSSITQYVSLYLAGAGLELDDLKQFRTFGSLTPGHPEYGHTDFVEITTGPLGSGISSAVGMAMAARRQRGMFDADASAGTSPFDHNVYVLAGDGCMQEGMTAEACSLAGSQELGNLIVIWDDNHISIEDDTNITFSEDVLARFAAYGWHTQRVDWLNGSEYNEDVHALDAAIENAKAETGRPSLIALRTIIGWPTPKKQNTGGIHGAVLGNEALTGLKEALGVSTEGLFNVDLEAVAHARANVAARGEALRSEWDERFVAWQEAHPAEFALFERLFAKELPAGWEEALPVFEEGKSIATRAASGTVLNALAPLMPELWGGSADLAGSNNTLLKGEKSFIPAARASKVFEASPYGRNLHFGVREHAMGAIMNGIALEGFTRIYGATFFVFSDYMRGAVRLAALMDLPVTYVWTHDSIGVGEDGPTHQPVEHLTSYRAIPNLAMVRPADAAETAEAWKQTLLNQHPVALILTRQNVPNPVRCQAEVVPAGELAPASGLARGGYVLRDCEGTADIILMASGSEVQFALEASEILSSEGVKVRVVSMPCMEWFDAQDAEYRESVLPVAVTKRVSIEAGLSMPWLKYLGGEGKAVSIESFGAVGSPDQLFGHFGITTENLVATAKEVLAH
ncbi:transketolase [Gleimia coleocanis DSM 15436]|uniref:Transketolase n=1 Tax=Gleimia coleocanis DSM 15436 TaxID=525245 RepID=C0W1H4_9ACTO|nr:transketolase [Gleimia coleocanis]EEH63340.1 transketolase [Gleimia coleocanis DSM 15436]